VASAAWAFGECRGGSPQPPPRKGRKKKNEEKKTRMPHARALCGLDLHLDARFRLFFKIAFMISPYRETPTNAIKQIDNEKFLDCTTRNFFVIAFLSSPLPRAA
jgi:hypothetical protein